MIPRLENIPVNTPLYLIDDQHNMYIAKVMCVNGIIQRGELIKGDEELFNRCAIIDWAYLNNENNKCKCECEWEDLEQGDTLYKESSWDGGIEFNYIRPIKYCPICGKLLPKYD